MKSTFHSKKRVIKPLAMATRPAGINLRVRRHLADIITVRLAVTRREVAVAGLHNFPCNRSTSVTKAASSAPQGESSPCYLKNGKQDSLETERSWLAYQDKWRASRPARST